MRISPCLFAMFADARVKLKICILLLSLLWNSNFKLLWLSYLSNRRSSCSRKVKNWTSFQAKVFWILETTRAGETVKPYCGISLSWFKNATHRRKKMTCLKSSTLKISFLVCFYATLLAVTKPIASKYDVIISFFSTDIEIYSINAWLDTRFTLCRNDSEFKNAELEGCKENNKRWVSDRS